MSRTSHNQGQEAEQACCVYLQQQGLELITRNYRGRRGEIDLVMRDGDTVVFVEVRFRSSERYGGALESITTRKQERFIATAELYLQQETKLKNGRIDVVAMSQKPQNTLTEQPQDYTFDWIRDAF